MMDVVVVFNGLGNQMSQYAFYLQKKKINPSTYLISFCKDHNGLEINSVFNIEWKDRFVNKLLYGLFRVLVADRFKIVTSPTQYLLKFLGCKVEQEDFNYNFNPDYLKPSKGITFYFGGWHTEKYFLNAKREVLNAFNFNKEVDEKSLMLIDEMMNNDSVALHVRRGDYLNEANINLFGKVCTINYFEKAIVEITNRIKSPYFYVFSNDIDWVKKNLKLDKVTYVTHNSGKDSWRDLLLMSNCKHNIISNSSFSWWGAWLNKHPKSNIISPARFLNSDKVSEVYPSHWIKISDC